MVTQGDFDTQAVDRLRSLGGETLVRKIATLFADFGSARVADATTGAATGDLPKVAQAAHALRSSAANVGATGLLAIATDLEQAARANQTDTVPTLVLNLRSSFDGARIHVLGFLPAGAA